MADRFSWSDGDCAIYEQIGTGGYGPVYLVYYPPLGKVVLKKLRDQNGIGDDDLEVLKLEANILTNLQHSNIVKIHESQFDRKFCRLFLEHVKYGSVDRFLERFPVWAEWKMQIIHDIASAMTYLHGRKPPIIHGDLKCFNVLIGDDYRAKISDFGFARMHTILKPFTAHSLKGTIEYIAPEYIRDPQKIKTKKFDVYSYGILVWEIFSMKRAYHDFCDRMLIPVSVEKGIRPMIEDIFDGIPKNVSICKTAEEIISECWEQDERRRPAFETIKLRVERYISTEKFKTQILFSRKEMEKNEQQGTYYSSRPIDSSTEQIASQKLGVQFTGHLEMRERLYGVAWFENKILVGISNRVDIFNGEKPYWKIDEFTIEELEEPEDMVASLKSLFIIDNQYLCRIQMSRRQINMWQIYGSPLSLSINSSNELIVVVVDGTKRFQIHKYSCDDGTLIKRIPLPNDVVEPKHIVQLSNSNFVIICLSGDASPVHLIKEVSADGKEIIRTFDPSTFDPSWNDVKQSWPVYMSIGEFNYIFIADNIKHRVVWWNPRLNKHRILVNRNQHNILYPIRLCYVREKHMLIVGQNAPQAFVDVFAF